MNNLNKTYAVFGLGRYGRTVAKTLSDSGAEVLAVDTDEEKVNEVAPDVAVAKCANITDPEVLRQLGVGDIDVVIIAMAGSLEATVMAIALCKEAGVKKVIVKCGNEMQERIFKKVGADVTVFPEKESGNRLAKNLISSGFVDMLELSRDVSLVEISVKPEWVGKNLIELDLRKKFGVNIVASKHGGELNTKIDPTAPLTENTNFIVVADRAQLEKMMK